MLHDLNILSASEQNTLLIPARIIQKFAPDTLSIMEFRTKTDLNIITNIYNEWPLLGEPIDEHWKATIRSEELNMTHDRELFNENKVGWPLYEGKMFHQYNHHFLEPRYWVDSKRGNEALAQAEMERVEDTLDRILFSATKKPHTSTRKGRLAGLWVGLHRGPLTIEDVHTDTEMPRLVFRRVASNTNERTFIATIIPPNFFLGHTVIYFVPRYFNGYQALGPNKQLADCYESALATTVLAYLCGVCNSFVIDYVLRFKTYTDVFKFFVNQLPVPRLTPDDIHCHAIARRVAQLVCIGPEFDALRQELLGSVNAHVATIHDERQHLQNEIDALVAHLYGLREEDLAHILYAPYTFPLVKREIKDGVMAAFAQVKSLLATDTTI